MKFPIYIHKTESETFSGFIPDIPGCYFAGDNLTETLIDAYCAIEAHLEYQIDRGHPLPVAKAIDEYKHHEDCQGGLWRSVEIDLNKYL